MCVLICTLGSDMPTRKQLENGCQNNPDGAGYVILYEDGTIITNKSLRDLDMIDEYLLNVAKPYVVASMFHARIGTSGGVNDRNCHPFKVTKGTYLAHNGIMNCVEVPNGSPDSDTAIFARMFKNMGGVTGLNNPDAWALWEAALGKGNKVGIITNEPNAPLPLIILNEEQGFWDDGKNVWFSNATCEYVWSYKTDLNAVSIMGTKINWEAQDFKDECPICTSSDIGKDGMCKFCQCCVVCEKSVCDCDSYPADDDWDDEKVQIWEYPYADPLEVPDTF